MNLLCALAAILFFVLNELGALKTSQNSEQTLEDKTARKANSGRGKVLNNIKRFFCSGGCETDAK